MSQIKNLTGKDELDIGKLGEEKTALFAVIPDNDTSFNYLVGMLYTQIFQELYNGSFPWQNKSSHTP